MTKPLSKKNLNWFLSKWRRSCILFETILTTGSIKCIDCSYREICRLAVRQIRRVIDAARGGEKEG